MKGNSVYCNNFAWKKGGRVASAVHNAMVKAAPELKLSFKYVQTKSMGFKC